MFHKQHTSSRIKELQGQWELLNRKIALLEREMIVETRKDEIFRMEQEVIRLKENLRPIKKELTRLKMQHLFLLGFVLFVLSAGGVIYLSFSDPEVPGKNIPPPEEKPKPIPPSVNPTELEDVATTQRTEKEPEHAPLVDPITGMQFIHVPGSCFQMGSPDNEPGRSDNEGPRHKVCVDDFRIGKYEVTQGQWVKVMGGMEKYQCEYRNGDEYPMEKVS